MLAPADATLDLIRFIERELDRLARAVQAHVEHAEGECALVIGGNLSNTKRRFRDKCARMGVLT